MRKIHTPKTSTNDELKKSIVLVHGLGGSSLSWTDPKNKNRFVERFLGEEGVAEHFSIYIFEYPTNIFEPFTIWKRLLSLIPITGSKRKKRNKKFNVGIRQISLQLASDVREVLLEYDSISLITHSMGGLVSKRAMVELRDKVQKVSLYVSLSVPHRGSILATIGSKLLKNPQLVDLSGFSEFTSELTDSYSNLNYKPKAIYQRGNQDEIVTEGAAIPDGVLAKDRIDTGDNHFTVLQIDKPNSNPVFLRVLKELEIIKFQSSSNGKANSPINFTVPENWSFQSTIQALVESSNCTSEFVGFSKEELKLELRPNEISKENTFQAVESIKFLNDNIPEYEIQIIKNHFKIIKK